jgi:hypothetical protein
MCEQCKALDLTLEEMLESKPAYLIMKLVKAQVHGAPLGNEFNSAVQQ